MNITLRKLVQNLADALKAIDGTGAHKPPYRPGIVPCDEAKLVKQALEWLQESRPYFYVNARVKRTPDLLIPDQWAIEFKVLRPFNDNGEEAEHWSENILLPYPGNTSSLGDCYKLRALNIKERKAVIIIGYEHTPPRIELETAVKAFEILAAEVCKIDLSQVIKEVRAPLIHPIHQQLCLFGYEILS